MTHTVETEAAALEPGERVSVAELKNRADRKNAQISYRSLLDTPMQLAIDFLAVADRTMKEGPQDADQAIRFASAAAAIAQAEQNKRIADALESLIVDLSDGEKTINTRQ